MNQVCQGIATVQEIAPGHWQLSIEADGTAYTNAQLDDYHLLPRSRYPWRPPLRLTLQARITGDCRGTYGFGFWNAPYSPLASKLLALPATAWFFGNGAGDLAWGMQSAPTGFKAATLDTRRWAVLMLAPFALLFALLLRIPIVYTWLWPWLCERFRLHEGMTSLDDGWHEYVIEWQEHDVRWLIDGNLVCRAPFAPDGSLGLCIWIDNQWLIAGPRRGFAWGVLPSRTMLEVKDIEVIRY